MYVRTYVRMTPNFAIPDGGMIAERYTCFGLQLQCNHRFTN